MKKILIVILTFFGSIGIILADNKTEVTFSTCVDGDTAKFLMNNKEIKVRFLAIDTPESVHPTIGIEAYGKESSKFTCDKITNASKIEIEFDPNSDEKDKYGRYLAWIWVDNYLLQDLLINEGFAEVVYLYGDYKYTDLLKEHQTIAKSKKIGIWGENIENSITDESNDIEDINANSNKKSETISDYIFYGVGILIIIIACAFSSTYRKKVFKKIKTKKLF